MELEICDSSKGRDTITAFAVLNPGIPVYYFASNNRNADKLEEVQEYMTDILSTLGKASDEDLRNASSSGQTGANGSLTPTLYASLLRKIVRFNRPRIEHYVRNMANELRFCIEDVVDSSDGDTAESKPEKQALSLDAR